MAAGMPALSGMPPAHLVGCKGCAEAPERVAQLQVVLQQRHLCIRLWGHVQLRHGAAAALVASIAQGQGDGDERSADGCAARYRLPARRLVLLLLLLLLVPASPSAEAAASAASSGAREMAAGLNCGGVYGAALV